MTAKKTALISVSDKTGVAPFAAGLIMQGYSLLSSGGTAQALREAGLTVQEVADYTGSPEMLGGRVKTLHPRVHGGILARRDNPDDMASLDAQQIDPIDLVIVNLYPFEQTVSKKDCTLATAVEQIDVGGPTLLRAAAKNFAHIGVVVDPRDYETVLKELTEQGALSASTRQALATKAFAHSAAYEQSISTYLSRQASADGQTQFPTQLSITFTKKQDMRYGENPHQNAAFYLEPGANFGIGVCEQLQGKELSFNNVADADTALECVGYFVNPACVIVKHANPCGVAVAPTLVEAYRRAFATDPVSAFGGIIAFNRPLDEDTAREILSRQFVEVIVAPDVTPGARSVLTTKSNVRVLIGGGELPEKSLDFKRVNGGLLVQDKDTGLINMAETRVATKVQPTEAQLEDLRFAIRVVKFVKSNAVIMARDKRTIAIGAGQMSRVDCSRIAILKAADAGLDLEGSVAASDAFFPFRDTVDRCAQAGVSAIITPGGSIRDEEVVAAADEHGIALVFTGMRHFRH